MPTWRGRSNFRAADAVLLDVTLITGGRSFPMNDRAFEIRHLPYVATRTRHRQVLPSRRRAFFGVYCLTIGIPRSASVLRRHLGEDRMDFRASLGAALPMAVLFAALSVATNARAFDESKYPDLSGVWRKPAGIGNQWDQTKPL